MSDRHELPIDPDPPPQPDGVDGVMMLAVAVGGIAGATARYTVAHAWPIESGTFPWATFVANVIGSLLLGRALVLLAEAWPGRARVSALISTGVLGAFTTMSTFLVEAIVLGKDGHVGVAVVYVVATVGVGLGAAAAGIRLGRLAEIVPAEERVS